MSKAGIQYVGADIKTDHYQSLGDVDIYCSAEDLPFANENFNLVFNQGSIDYMPQSRRFWPRLGEFSIQEVVY